MSRQIFQQLWKNKTSILEGIKNSIFKKEDIEEVFTDRMSICETCPSLDIGGSRCAVKGSNPCCGTCGCSLGFKLRALSAECPEGKWQAVTTQEEEDLLRSTIK